MSRYFEDKTNIFKYQKSGDTLILGEEVARKVESGEWKVVSKIQIAKKETVPKDWKIKIPGEHNLANVACAIEACKALGLTQEEIKIGVESFEGVEGRLQFMKEINGVKIYNDNNATTPEATLAALHALGHQNKKNIVLLIGGDDKKMDMGGLVNEIPKYCSKVVMFKERGTEKIRERVLEMKKDGIDVYEEDGLSDTVSRAFKIAEDGEIILYSPAFSSFGKYFKNEYDRGDQFMEIIKNLK